MPLVASVFTAALDLSFCTRTKQRPLKTKLALQHCSSLNRQAITNKSIVI